MESTVVPIESDSDGIFCFQLLSKTFKCGSRGGAGGPEPPWKMTILVSIGNKQLDPPGKS